MSQADKAIDVMFPTPPGGMEIRVDKDVPIEALREELRRLRRDYKHLREENARLTKELDGLKFGVARTSFHDMRKALDNVHKVLGEAVESDDLSLGDAVKAILDDYKKALTRAP